MKAFKPGEGHSRSGLLHACENFADSSFAALLHYSGCMYLRLWSGSQLEVLGEEEHHALDAAAGQPLGGQREARVADLSTAVSSQADRQYRQCGNRGNYRTPSQSSYLWCYAFEGSPELTTLKRYQQPTGIIDHQNVSPCYLDW